MILPRDEPAARTLFLGERRMLNRWLLLLGWLVSSSAMLADDALVFGPNDWPWWRGPNFDGHADPKQNPPVRWSATENVLWKAPLPGRGHGSATVVGERVYLTTAEANKEAQSVLAFDRATGKQLWQTVVNQGPFEKKGNTKSSHACCTPACDGKRLYVNFLNNEHVYATALDLDGKQLWQTKICNYVMHQGFGASPALYRSLVIIAVDHKGGGTIAGLERSSGKIVWTVPRPKQPNYSSPIIVNVGGKDQLILTGCDTVTSYEPLTGKVLWETKGATTECVTSTVTDGTHIFTSGGYPKNHVAAVKADGSGKVVWEKGTRVYVPSMFVLDKHLYAVQDAGSATCWEAATGKEIWSGRLGGTFSASPVPVGDRVYAVNEAGKMYVFKATPKGLDIIAENQLGTDVFATPTICGNRIYLRTVLNDGGQRQEMLFCLGAK